MNNDILTWYESLFGPMTEDTKAGRMNPSMKAYKPGARDALRASEKIARDMAESAPRSMLEALNDPTLANVTNAGVQTALTLGRVTPAAGILTAGLGIGAAKDAGLFGSAAEAGDGGVDPLGSQRKRYETLSKQLTNDGYLPRQLRDEYNGYLKIVQEAQARDQEARLAQEREQAASALRIKESEAERKRNEDAIAVKRANDEMARIRGKDTRFADTAFGQVVQKVAGYDPVLAGGAAGVITPGKGAGGYGLPALMGAFAGVGASNGPLLYDAYRTPVLNPEREAYEAGARMLPSDHPDVARYKGFLAETNPDGTPALPIENPVRSAAQKELGDGWSTAKRIGLGAIEGAGGAMLGHDLTKVPGMMIDGTKTLWSKITGQADDVASSVSGQGAFRGGQNQMPPAGPGAASPGRIPYPSLPPEVKGPIRSEYAASIARNYGDLPSPKPTASNMKAALNANGIDASVTAKRVAATNDAVKTFVAANGRMPMTRQEWASIFNDKTLAVPLAVGGASLFDMISNGQGQ